MKVTIKNNSLIFVSLLAFSLIFKGYLFVGIIFCFISLLFYGRVLKISVEGICIFLFSLLYFIIYINNYGYTTSSLLSCLLIYLFFVVGQQLSYVGYEKKKIVLVIVFAFMFHSVLIFLFGIRKSSIVVGSNEVRAYYDVFLRMKLNATGIEAYYIPVMGALYYLIKFLPKIKYLSYITLLIILVSIIMIGGRGALFIFLLSIGICGFLDYKFLTENRKKVGKFAKKILTLLIVLTIVYIIYSTNIFGVRDKIDSSFLIYRFQYMIVNENSVFASAERVNQNIAVLQNIDDLWLRGGKTTGLEFIHNVILSMINSTGIFPVIFYVIFLVLSIKNTYYNLKNWKNEDSFLCFGIMISCISFMMIEPVFESVPWMLMIISLISGMQIVVKEEIIEYGE